MRATPGVRSAVALTPTTLGPSLGISDDLVPAQILSGGQGGGLDVDVTAGSLGALHGDTIALGKRRASAAHAEIGDRVPVTLGDGTRTRANVVAIYTPSSGSATHCSPPSSRPAARPVRSSRRSSSRPPTRPPSRGACGHSRRGIRGCG